MPVNNTSRTERICALTDGVYAIVITLLVLDLKAPEIPGLTEGQLLDVLLIKARSFITYIISFIVIALFWFRHHEIFKSLACCNNFFIGINFLHILLLTLIPFTASLAGQYEEEQLAVQLFLVNLWLTGLTIALLSGYIVNKTNWHEKKSVEQFLKQNWLYRYSAIVFGIPVIIFSFFSHDVALYICLGLPIVLPVVILLVIRRK